MPLYTLDPSLTTASLGREEGRWGEKRGRGRRRGGGKRGGGEKGRWEGEGEGERGEGEEREKVGTTVYHSEVKKTLSAQGDIAQVPTVRHFVQR